MATPSNRRDFLKASAAVGAGFWIATREGLAQNRSPNERINVASIAVGGKGDSDSNDAGRLGNLVAICDVDENTLNRKAEKFPKAKKYTDFRKMLDEMGKEIDAVTVSTPDHQHAFAALLAISMGKHAFVQKPLCHDVWEARTLTLAAKKHRVCTQMGNQGTSTDGLRKAVDAVRAGLIGQVSEVHVWTNRPVWPQGTNAVLGIPGVNDAIYKGEAAASRPPRTLHWDEWIGTAPMRAYYPDTYHTFKWRGWWDFGTGALGDMACHTANMAFMACELGYPTLLQAETSEFNNQTFPTWSIVRYDFPERRSQSGGTLAPLKWTWYDGGNDKPRWINEKLKELAGGRDIPGSGSLLIGDKATLFSPNDYGEDWVILPKGESREIKRDDFKVEEKLPRAHGQHMEEWFKAMHAGKPELALSNFGYAGPLTETVVLGCIAQRFAPRKLEWDGPNMKIPNMKEPNNFIKRQYRSGWELPGSLV
ncbi:MAG: Gfo/Idh/MocA family oxidoreductase [Phycisphaerae bacterium]